MMIRVLFKARDNGQEFPVYFDNAAEYQMRHGGGWLMPNVVNREIIVYRTVNRHV